MNKNTGVLKSIRFYQLIWSISVFIKNACVYSQLSIILSFLKVNFKGINHQNFKSLDKLNTILTELHSLADKDSLPAIAHFGIDTHGRLGISIPDLRRIAKPYSHDHPLALSLWETGIPEARILASMIDDPLRVSPDQEVM